MQTEAKSPVGLAAAPGSAVVVDDLMERMRAEAARLMEMDTKLNIEPIGQELAECIAWNRIQKGFENRELAQAIRVILCFCVEEGTGIWALLDEARHRLEQTPTAVRQSPNATPSATAAKEDGHGS